MHTQLWRFLFYPLQLSACRWTIASLCHAVVGMADLDRAEQGYLILLDSGAHKVLP